MHCGTAKLFMPCVENKPLTFNRLLTFALQMIWVIFMIKINLHTTCDLVTDLLTTCIDGTVSRELIIVTIFILFLL